MKIIVNADDMGYTRGISEGIVYGYQNGIVTSTTVMCHMPYAEQVPGLLEPYEGLGVGVHLTLTCGSPLTPARSLVDSDGRFLKYREFYSRRVDPEEVRREFKAQIEKFISLFHRLPTHMDSHQGAHDGVSVLVKDHPEMTENHNTKEIYEVSMELAKEYGLPVRRSCPYTWIDGYYGEKATPETFIEIIENHPDEDLEFMVHPGYCDLDVYKKSSYHFYRVKELAGLCDEKTINYIKTHNIELVHF